MAADRAVKRIREAKPEHQSVSTSLIAAVVRDRKLIVASVGSCEGYLVGSERNQEVTDPRTTRLSGEGSVVVQVFSHEIQDGDRLVLCTPELGRQIPREEIFTIVRESPSPEAAVATLVKKAGSSSEAEGGDNVTAVVFHAG
jgi:serine/threonine protein phosphatase PrpC